MDTRAVDVDDHAEARAAMRQPTAAHIPFSNELEARGPPESRAPARDESLDLI
jgi:hypothetical protein